MATDALFNSVEVAAIGSTNMGIISVFGARDATAAAGGPRGSRSHHQGAIACMFSFLARPVTLVRTSSLT